MPSDQAGFGQIGPGLVQSVRIHGQTPTDGPVVVIAQPGRIGDSHQEQIQRRGRVAQPLDMPVTHQAMVEPTELARYLANEIGDNGRLDTMAASLGWGRYDVAPNCCSRSTVMAMSSCNAVPVKLR